MNYNVQIVDILNKFRVNPQSFEKTFQTVSKALKRSKQSEAGTELENISNNLKNYNELPVFKMSEGLMNSSKVVLDSITRLKKNLEKNLVCNILNENLEKYDNSVVFFKDEGDIDNVLIRLISSSEDKTHSFQNLILDKKSYHVGVATKSKDDELSSILIFVENLEENKKEDYGEDGLLKEAFDLFDVFNNGKLNQVELKEAFVALGFDKDSYSVYKAILKLNEKDLIKDGIKYDVFRDTVKSLVGSYNSKEDLKKIFDLFVDSPTENKITAESLKRVSRELNDKLTYEEIVNVLKRATNNGVDIDFDEFCKILEQAADLHSK